MTSNNWTEWPKWSGEGNFRTPRYQFSCSVSDYSGKTSRDDITLLKNKEFIELYRDQVFNEPVNTIFEIGFFQGGMPLFLADMVAPEKIVAVDWNPPSEELLKLVKSSDLQTAIDLIGNIDQSDTQTIRSILDRNFGDRPLDLIIDDCSHYYPQTKACFQALFGYLKPGGKYIIEDWGWTHWPGAPWQTSDSPFEGMPSMSNLIFELVMGLASNDKIIASVNVVSAACVIVTRGPDLAYKEEIDLARMTHVAGGRRANLIEPPDIAATSQDTGGSSSFWGKLFGK